jgi:hypothetical protein
MNLLEILFNECSTAGTTGPAKYLKNMAGTTRLELATSAVTGQRSNQLNYVPSRGISDLA